MSHAINIAYLLWPNSQTIFTEGREYAYTAQIQQSSEQDAVMAKISGERIIPLIDIIDSVLATLQGLQVYDPDFSSVFQQAMHLRSEAKEYDSFVDVNEVSNLITNFISVIPDCIPESEEDTPEEQEIISKLLKALVSFRNELTREDKLQEDMRIESEDPTLYRHVKSLGELTVATNYLDENESIIKLYKLYQELGKTSFYTQPKLDPTMDKDLALKEHGISLQKFAKFKEQIAAYILNDIRHLIEKQNIAVLHRLFHYNPDLAQFLTEEDLAYLVQNDFGHQVTLSSLLNNFNAIDPEALVTVVTSQEEWSHMQVIRDTLEELDIPVRVDMLSGAHFDDRAIIAYVASLRKHGIKIIIANHATATAIIRKQPRMGVLVYDNNDPDSNPEQAIALEAATYLAPYSALIDHRLKVFYEGAQRLCDEDQDEEESADNDEAADIATTLDRSAAGSTPPTGAKRARVMTTRYDSAQLPPYHEEEEVDLAAEQSRTPSATPGYTA